MPRAAFALGLALVAALPGCGAASRTWSDQRVLMGTVFRIQVHAPPSDPA